VNSKIRKIAYLGPPGTYSEQAAEQWSDVDELLPLESIPAVAKSVEDGESFQGVLPIENSIEGGVTFTLDLLIHDSSLAICGEVIVPINHSDIFMPALPHPTTITYKVHLSLI